MKSHSIGKRNIQKIGKANKFTTYLPFPRTQYSFNLKYRSKDTSSPNNETVYSFKRATQTSPQRNSHFFYKHITANKKFTMGSSHLGQSSVRIFVTCEVIQSEWKMLFQPVMLNVLTWWDSSKEAQKFMPCVLKISLQQDNEVIAHTALCRCVIAPPSAITDLQTSRLLLSLNAIPSFL